MTGGSRAREVLEERARRLARPPAPAPPADQLELVTFTLAGEVYGVESRFVLESFRLADLTPLPGAQRPVTGLTGWRGGLLLVLDLRPATGGESALPDLSHVVVLGDGAPEREVCGLLADEVRGLVSVAASEVRKSAEGVAAGRAYVRGITPDVVLVLDASALFQLLR